MVGKHVLVRVGHETWKSLQAWKYSPNIMLFANSRRLHAKQITQMNCYLICFSKTRCSYSEQSHFSTPQLPFAPDWPYNSAFQSKWDGAKGRIDVREPRQMAALATLRKPPARFANDRNINFIVSRLQKKLLNICQLFQTFLFTFSPFFARNLYKLSSQGQCQLAFLFAKFEFV